MAASDTVQVLLRDQDDDCFGLWMFQEDRLVEVTIPRTERFHQPAPPNEGTSDPTRACCCA